MDDVSVHGRYRLQRPLGRGGQSRVFLARDEARAGESVVLKHMISRGVDEKTRHEELELFLQEGRILAQYEHPSLPCLVESFENESGHYVVETMVGEVNLDHVLAERGGYLTAHEVAWIGHQLLELLDFLHQREPPVVVRDIKPSNITVHVDADGMIRRDRPVYFIDLTIAVFYRPEQEDEVNMGSPGYAPPEQYRGYSQPRSDLYALGATLLQALTGHDVVATPFRMPAASSVRPNLRRGWDAFFARALAMDLADRFQSAQAMQAALEKLMPRARCAEPLRAPVRAVRGGNRMATALWILAALGASAGLAVWLISRTN